VSEFETTAQVCRLATSVGGVLTGRGADIIIIDDPLKPEEALSQAQRQAANEWYDHTLYSRLNDTRTGAIILIMHRLHEDDLAGHVLAQEDWEVVRLAAIAEDDESYALDTELGQYLFTRRCGEALHPERQPSPTLEQIRRTLGKYNFAGQYQQAPAPQGGGIVKAVWFHSYTPPQLHTTTVTHQTNGRTNSTVSCRAGTPPTRRANSVISACAPPGASRARTSIYCLLHVMRKRTEYPELKRAVREQCEAFAASVVLIEDKASGTQLIQELIEEGPHAVTRYQPQSDKIMRMHAQTAMIENGFVHLPKEAAWLAEYLHELTAFPRGKHDDQVDSTAQRLDWFKQAGREPQDWMWQMYKQHQAQQARDPQTVKPEPLSVIAKRLGVLRW
jgi:predicted phage terminase large subunit-like protein